MPAPNSKPFNRRWPFIAVGVLAAFGILGSLTGNNNDAAAPAASPTATATASATVEAMASWTGTTLEGEPVIIYDDGGDTSFTGDLPSPIDWINQQTTCEGLAGEYTLWVGSDASSPEGAKRLSAYANHALAVAQERGCAPLR